MPQAGEVYKCEQCGNIVYVVEGGGAELVCCGEEMKLQGADVAKSVMNKIGKPGSP
jgi:superoxide reductase